MAELERIIDDLETRLDIKDAEHNRQCMSCKKEKQQGILRLKNISLGD